MESLLTRFSHSGHYGFQTGPCLCPCPHLRTFEFFIAPSTDYSLEVSANGYKNWSVADQYNASKPLHLGPGTHLNLEVNLEAIP
jgi:hypothetical protein